MELFTRVVDLPEEEQGGDMTHRMILTHGDGTCVLAHQDFTYEEANYPDPASWGEIASAQAELERHISLDLKSRYRKGCR